MLLYALFNLFIVENISVVFLVFILPSLYQMWERMKVVIEPAAACAVAAVLSHKFREKAGPDVKRVGVVLCGGNVDLDNIPWIKN